MMYIKKGPNQAEIDQAEGYTVSQLRAFIEGDAQLKTQLNYDAKTDKCALVNGVEATNEDNVTLKDGDKIEFSSKHEKFQ